MIGTPDSLVKAKLLPGMSVGQVLQFFVLMPAVLGMFLGMARLGSQAFVSVEYHIAYTSVVFVLSWICSGVGTKVTSWALRPWQPSLLVVLLVGYQLGSFGLWWPVRDVVNAAFAGFLVPGSRFHPYWPPEPDRWVSTAVYAFQGISWWLIANWIDFRYRRVSRFGFAPAPEAEALKVAAGQVAAVNGLAVERGDPGRAMPADEGSTAFDAGTNSSSVIDTGPPGVADATGVLPPRLQARLPAHLRDGQIYVLEAEEHYTNIYTSKGKFLLLIRFSDAIAEMTPQQGLQVHRSFWVSRHAVDHLLRVDRRWVLRLVDGMEIPVSRSYLIPVQSAGLTGGAPMPDG